MWDVCTHEEAAKLVDMWIRLGHSTTKAAELLAEYALDKGSMDNVTVIVVWIRWGENLPPLSESEKVAGEALLECLKGPSSKQVAASLPKTIGLSSDPPLYLTSLADVKLQASYFYLSRDQNDFCVRRIGQQFPLPCWVHTPCSFDGLNKFFR